MSPDYTPRQRLAIDLRGCNILVSASAGAGKTAVLTERIVELLLDADNPVDIDRIVVVTFTRAAAAEMRTRIAGKLAERLNEDPDNAHIEKQLALISHAPITTIDSFCLNIVRNYFYTIKLDPSFRIGDKEEMAIMQEKVLDELLEDEYKKSSEAFLDMMETFAPGKSDLPVHKLILNLYRVSQSHAWPNEWLEDCGKIYNIESPEDIQIAGWYNISGLELHIYNVIRDSYNALELAYDMLDGIGIPDEKIDKVKEFIESEKAYVGSICDIEGYIEIGKALKTYEPGKFPAVRLDGELREIKDEAKALRDAAKKGLVSLINDYYERSPEDVVQDIRMCGPAVRELLRITLEFSERFAACKEENNVLDFNDVEHYALKILVKRDSSIRQSELNDAAKELIKQYEYILIDEYQDSNDVQETILTSISRSMSGQPNMFMVGDVKQSIYQFRLAKPEIFEKKLAGYRNADIDSVESFKDIPGVKILLKKNFRSSAAILKTINYIFSNVMHRELGKVEYDKTHYFDIDEDTQENDGEPVEVLYITGDNMGNDYSKRQLEAMAIANRIRELNSEDEVPYSDIVILLRTMSGWAEEFVEILTSKGIPVVAEEQKGYFSALEIQTVISMLRIIDNPRQDIPLAAVLRSVYGGFSDEELAVIRNEGEGDLYDAICIVADTSYDSDNSRIVQISVKCREFLKMLNGYRHISPYVTVYELIMELLGEKDYINHMKAMPSGARREGNLIMLANKALAYDNTDNKGLASFINYIDRMKKADIDFGEAKTADGVYGAVKIMSIHKSKGLEYPVVFVAGMGKPVNLTDSRQQVLIHSDIGPAPDYLDTKKRIKRSTLLKKAVSRKMINDVIGEELRILYVALTRAKSRLIMTGYIDNAENKLEEYRRMRNSYTEMISGKACYYDWLSPCILKKLSYRIIHMEELIDRETTEYLSREIRRKSLEKEALMPVKNRTARDSINADREYVYPYTAETGYSLKVSVSDIKHRAAIMEDEEAVSASWAATEHPVYIPSFARDQAEDIVSGADRGTMYHILMEHLDIESICSPDDADKYIKILVNEGILPDTAASGRIISGKKIFEFCKSNVAKRMIAADKKGMVSREQPFVMGIPASRVYPDTGSDEIILVQGIIDVYFEEEDGIVLLDYKTDRINPGEEDKLVSRYKAQMDCYSEAIEKASGKKVKEIILYSFSLNKEVKVDTDE